MESSSLAANYHLLLAYHLAILREKKYSSAEYDRKIRKAVINCKLRLTEVRQLQQSVRR